MSNEIVIKLTLILFLTLLPSCRWSDFSQIFITAFTKCLNLDKKKKRTLHQDQVLKLLPVNSWTDNHQVSSGGSECLNISVTEVFAWFAHSATEARFSSCKRRCFICTREHCLTEVWSTVASDRWWRSVIMTGPLLPLSGLILTLGIN